MAWKEIRNSEPDMRSDTFSGKCLKCGKTATVTVQSAGSMYCKTDLHKTYHKVGFKCSLLEEAKGTSFCSCMESCPLVPEKFL